MSWWASITDPETGHHLIVEPFEDGGTYVLGGSSEADLNITYNYSGHYYRVLDIGGGLRGLNDVTVKDALPVLERGIEQLGTEESDDYWESTEGNARRALVTLAGWCKSAISQGKDSATMRIS